MRRTAAADVLIFQNAEKAHQHDGDLRAGCVALRGEDVAFHAADDPLADRPVHRADSVCADLFGIQKGVQLIAVNLWAVRVTIQYGCQLLPRDGIVRTKGSIAVTFYNVIGACPTNSLRVIGTGCNIRK